MKRKIEELSKSKKISISHSIRIQTHRFVRHHCNDLSNYHSKQDLLNDLYFYWIRNSADTHYAWNKEMNALCLSSRDIVILKQKIEKALLDYLASCPTAVYQPRLFNRPFAPFKEGSYPNVQQ